MGDVVEGSHKILLHREERRLAVHATARNRVELALRRFAGEAIPAKHLLVFNEIRAPAHQIRDELLGLRVRLLFLERHTELHTPKVRASSFAQRARLEAEHKSAQHGQLVDRMIELVPE